MPELWAVLGAGLLVVGLYDMVWTTIAVSAGGGPVTARLSHGLWVLARRLGRSGRHQHRDLRVAGVLIVLATFGFWVGAVWVGWSLVFSASDGAVLSAQTGSPTDLLGRFYYAGFTVFTLGTGDLVPGNGSWQLLTVLATFTGLAVVTMGITFLVPVTQAVTARRTMSMRLSALGRSPEELVTRWWAGEAWRAELGTTLDGLSEELMALGQRHLAYPILHYFHDVEASAAAAVAIPRLDEALTLLEHGVAEDARPEERMLIACRAGIGSLLGALTSAYIDPTADPPPLPSLEPLRAANIPTVDQAAFVRGCARVAERRRALRGFVEDDGWRWSDLRGGDDAEASEARGAIDVHDSERAGRER